MRRCSAPTNKQLIVMEISRAIRGVRHEMSTTTTLVGDDTVLYQVRMPDGSLDAKPTHQPSRQRYPSSDRTRLLRHPTYASYYRSVVLHKKSSLSFWPKLAAEYDILESDYCGFDSAGQPPQRRVLSTSRTNQRQAHFRSSTNSKIVSQSAHACVSSLREPRNG